jgi:hypothetical protein
MKRVKPQGFEQSRPSFIVHAMGLALLGGDPGNAILLNGV